MKNMHLPLVSISSKRFFPCVKTPLVAGLTLMALALVANAAETVILNDDFNYSPSLTTLNGVSPSSAAGGVGSGTWVSVGGADALSTNGSQLVATGTSTTNVTAGDIKYAVSLQANTVYTLTAVVNLPTIFQDPASPAYNDYMMRLGFYDSATDWTSMILFRPASSTSAANHWGLQNNTFADGVVSHVAADPDMSGPVTVKITLDTNSNTLQYFINDVASVGYTLSDAHGWANISSIQFGMQTNNLDGQLGTVDSISLTASSVPEPSSAVLLGLGVAGALAWCRVSQKSKA